MKHITFIICLQLICGSARAQSAVGEIDGSITDSMGTILVGALVHVEQEGVITGADTVSDVEGKYAILRLPSGKYDVIAQYKGMKKMRHRNVVISPSGGLTFQNIKMQAGDAQTEAATDYNLPQRPQSGGNCTALSPEQMEHLSNSWTQWSDRMFSYLTEDCFLPYHKVFTNEELQRMPIRDVSSIMDMMGIFRPAFRYPPIINQY